MDNRPLLARLSVRTARSNCEEASLTNQFGAIWGAIFLSAALAMLVVRPAAATTWQWTGSTSSDMSGTTTNYWNGASNGAPGAGDIVEFNAPGYYTDAPSMNSALAIGGLWFAGDDSDGLTIGGASALTLNSATINGNTSAGIEVDAGSGPVAVGAPLELGNSQTWFNNSTSALTIGGALNLNGTTLTIAGGGGVDLAGPISGSSGGGLIISSGPVTILGNNVAYGGTTTVETAGVLLSIENTNALGSGPLLLGSGGTVPNVAIDAPLSNLSLNNAVTYGGIAFIGTHNLSFGTLTIPSTSGGFVLDNSALTFNGAATNTNTGSASLNIPVAGYNSTPTTGSLIFNSGLSLTGSSSQASFEFSGFNNVAINGVVSNGSAAAPSLIWAPTLPSTTLFLAGANTFSGSLQIEGGIVSTGTGGTLQNSGAASSIGKSGQVTITSTADNGLGATLQYANTSATNESTNVQITIGGTATIDASGTNQITFANMAAMTVSATSVTALTFTGSGAGVFDPKIINGSGSGTISLTKTGLGSWTLGNTETYTGSTTVDLGAIILASGATLASPGLALNGGTLVDANGGSQTFSQSLMLGQGGSGVEVNANTTTLSLGTIATHTQGKILAFTIPSGLIGSGITVGNTTVTDGILGGWAVVNGSNWATQSGGAVIALTNYTGTLPSTTTSGSSANYTLGAGQVQGGNVSGNSLNITDGTSGDTLALGSSTLTFNSSNGGLLYSGGSHFNITGTNYLGAGSGNEFIITIGGSGNLTINAPLIGNAGTGSLTIAGAGTLVLGSGASTNNYSGTTYVDSGMLQLDASSNPTGSGASLALVTGPTGKGGLSVNGSAILDLNGNNLAVSGLSSYIAGNGGTIANSSTTAGGTPTIVTSGTPTYYGTIADTTGGGNQTVSVVLAGSGTQTLAGQSTYSGGTTVFGATTLAVGASSLLNNGGTVVSSPVGTGALTINSGATIQLNSTDSSVASGEIMLANNIVLTGNATFATNGSAFPMDFAGQISGSGGITASFSNANSAGSYIALSNPNNSFTGGLSVPYYNFMISTDGALPAGSNVDVGYSTSSGSGSSAKLYFEESNGTQTIGSLTGNGVLSFGGATPTVVGTFTLIVGAGDAGSTFNGGIQSGSGATFALTKIGAGTLILGPTANTNTYTGKTTIDDGTLELDGTGSTVVLSASSPLVFNGGTLKDAGSTTGGQSFASTTVFAGASAVATVSGIGHSLALGAIARNVGGTLNFDPFSTTGTGKITTTTTNTNGVLGGWAVFSSGANLGTNWAMSGTSGTNAVSGYTGGSPISGSGSFLTTATTNYLVTANTTDTDAAAIGNTIEFGNTSVPATLSSTNLAITTGGILVPSSVASATSITGGTITGPAGNTSANDLIVNQYSASPLTIGSVIANNGTPGASSTALTISGPGTTILTATNTYVGGTFLASGTLQIGGGGMPATTGTLGSGNVTMAAGAVLAFDRSDNGLVVSNVITGAGAVQQIGGGTTSLSGANTYTGGTNITAGTLTVANTAGSATGIGSVDTSGTLAGSLASGQGFISGPVVISGGGMLSTNNSLAATTLTLSGGLSLGSSSATNFTLNGNSPNGTTNPLVNVSGGSLTVAGSSSIGIAFSGSSIAGTFDLFGYSNLAPGSFGNLTLNTTGDPTGYSYTLVNNTNSSQIDLNVVVSTLTWTGANGSAWDASTYNWAAGSSPNAVAARYYDGANVVFADDTPISGQSVPTTNTSNSSIRNSSALATVSLSGNVSPNSIVFTNNGPGAMPPGVDYAITGSGSIARNTGIMLSGTGTVFLATANTFTGTVAVNSGQLVLGNAAALGNTSGVAVVSGGALGLQSGPGSMVSYGTAVGASTPIVTSLIGSGPSGNGALVSLNGINTYSGAITIGSGGATIGSLSNASGDGLTLSGGIDNGGNLLTFTGAGTTTVNTDPIVGLGGLKYSGMGMLNLAVASSYGGSTNVNSGTLRVTNSPGPGSATGNGTVAIASGAALGGSGSVGGLVSVAAGGILTPSDVSGTTTQLNLGGGSSLADGATSGTGAVLDMNLTTPSSGDLIYITGNLSLGENGVLNINPYNSPSSPVELATGDYPLIKYTGTLAVDNSDSWKVGTTGGDAGHSYSFMSTTVSGQNVFELVVSNAIWTSGSDGNWGVSANWSTGAGATVPNGPGQCATFGSSGTTMNLTVTLDNNYTVGQLIFNSSATAYTLTSNQLTLDNQGNGASVTVASGAASPVIQPTLALNDSNRATTFNIAGGALLDMAGPIVDGTRTDQQIKLTGGGTLQLDNANNTYSGGTTVQNGTLTVSSGGSIGSGALTFNPTDANDSASVNVRNSIQINNLSQQSGSLGSAWLNIARNASVTLNQTASANFSGAIGLSSGSLLTVQQNTANIFSVSTAPSFDSPSTLAVNSGTVAFNVNNGTATVNGTNVNVTVASGATLQLTGSVSVLSSSSNSANVANDGTLQVVGLSNQTVGIVGSLSPPTTDANGATIYAGNTVVGDGLNAASLSATQILQNTLTINANSTVTILPSGGGLSDIESATIATPAAAALTTVAATDTGDAGASDFSDTAISAIQTAIASGAISSTAGQVLENRITAIDRLSAMDSDLNARLLESRVLAMLPLSSAMSAVDFSPAPEATPNLQIFEGGSFAAVSGDNSAMGVETEANVPSVSVVGSSAVAEPTSMLLAVMGIGLVLVFRCGKCRYRLIGFLLFFLSPITAKHSLNPTTKKRFPLCTIL